MKSTTYNSYPVHLIESVDEFSYIRSLLDPKVRVGIDTETTGLSYVTDRIVGVCISCGHSYSTSDYHGFYLPVRHSGYPNNLPIPAVISLVQEITDQYYTVYWNRSFDFSMLELDGFSAPFVGKTHDAQIMAHLTTGDSYPALKDYAHNYLHFDVINFDDNNSKDHNFGTTDPLVSYKYGCQDPLITVLLARKLWTEYPYIQKIYPIDNKSSEALRVFSRDTVIPLDFDVIQRELERVQAEQASVRAQIFSLCGYEFRLTSNQDKADALCRFVTLTQKTKSGKFAINDEVLATIDHPLARLFQRYAELEKYRGSYVAKMLTFPSEGIHINYSTCNVSTGRLSSGSAKGNDYFANFNIQNVPKVELMRFVHTDPVLGYSISDDEFRYSSVNTGVSCGDKEFYKITLDDGREVLLNPNSPVKILRNGEVQYTMIDNLMSTDDILIES